MPKPTRRTEATINVSAPRSNSDTLPRSPWYFESLDRLSEALTGTDSVDAMVQGAVSVVRGIFR